MKRKTTLDNYIREFRSEGKIPKCWSPSDLKAVLGGIFSSRTLSVYPNNYSISSDGKRMGDAVKRGQAAKYVRLGNATFILNSEFDNSIVNTIIHESIHKQSNIEANIMSRSRKRIFASDISRPDYFNKLSKKLGIRLLEVFPTKSVLLHYADLCAENYRRNSESLQYYLSIIGQHDKHGIHQRLSDEGFIRQIYNTLKKWDMNYRGAKLVSFSELSASISKYEREIIELAKYSMDKTYEYDQFPLKAKLEELFVNIKIMQTNSQIVGVSKTFHFLLPRLVMPIDGKFTMKFFFGYRPYKPSIGWEFSLFWEIFVAYSKYAHYMGLVDHEGARSSWNTTVPKIIDNAIIGYVRVQEIGRTRGSK